MTVNELTISESIYLLSARLEALQKVVKARINKDRLDNKAKDIDELL